MIKEISNQNTVKIDENVNNVNYLWLNGEKVIGVKGLQVFEDCKQLYQMPDLSKEQIDTLNSIIDSTLEKNAEEGICNNWTSIVEAAGDFLSEKGYCVVKEDKITVELRKKVEVEFQPKNNQKVLVNGKSLTAADLWNIYQQRRTRQLRKFI